MSVRPVDQERFWARTRKRDDGCWEFLGCLVDGYGTFSHGGRRHYAHRVAYEIVVGRIPEGLTLDHLCKYRACVNPEHLEPVTLAENVLRGDSPPAINARKTHCGRGHEFTPENTAYWKKGRRACRQCNRENHRRWWAQNGRAWRDSRVK